MKKLTAFIITAAFFLSACKQNEQPLQNSTAPETTAATETVVVEENVIKPEVTIDSPQLNEYTFTEEDKKKILNVLQITIEKYKKGKIENNELEPKFSKFPESYEYPKINSADDFEIYLSSSDMYLCYVPFILTKDTAEDYKMEFRLNRAEPSLVDIGNGNAKEGDIFWVVDGVQINKINI